MQTKSKQYKPVILPIIKNTCPMLAADMFDLKVMEESNRQLYAKINELLAELDCKVAIEHRDGSVTVLDEIDPQQILEEIKDDYVK